MWRTEVDKVNPPSCAAYCDGGRSLPTAQTSHKTLQTSCLSQHLLARLHSFLSLWVAVKWEKFSSCLWPPKTTICLQFSSVLACLKGVTVWEYRLKRARTYVGVLLGLAQTHFVVPPGTMTNKHFWFRFSKMRSGVGLSKQCPNLSVLELF